MRATSLSYSIPTRGVKINPIPAQMGREAGRVQSAILSVEAMSIPLCVGLAAPHTHPRQSEQCD